MIDVGAVNRWFYHNWPKFVILANQLLGLRTLGLVAPRTGFDAYLRHQGRVQSLQLQYVSRQQLQRKCLVLGRPAVPRRALKDPGARL